ncbi:MAG: BatD family protein, partial [Bacteroidota bacterium]
MLKWGYFFTTILCTTLLLASNVSAQEEVSFELKLSKEKLGINERLRVEFTMNKDGDNFNPPSFEGFKVVMGPSQSISSSWINGKRTFSKTYSYILVPTARGRFTIKQATIEISG